MLLIHGARNVIYVSNVGMPTDGARMQMVKLLHRTLCSLNYAEREVATQLYICLALLLTDCSAYWSVGCLLVAANISVRIELSQLPLPRHFLNAVFVSCCPVFAD